MDNLIEENISLKNDNKELRDKVEHNSIEIEKMKQKSLCNKLEFTGIEDITGISTTEQITTVVKSLGTDLKADHIKYCYRSKNISKNSGEPEKVIVQFSNIEITKQIMSKNKEKKKDKEKLNMAIFESYQKKDNAKPIFINEKLTSYFSLLFKKARDMKRENK